MTDLKSMTIEELTGYLLDKGEKAFRAKQIFKWIHKMHADSIDDMTDISLSLRETLKKECLFTGLKAIKEQTSKDGTKKYLFELPDGERIESVKMDYRHGHSVCISSQVGCAMGCAFCASTIGGLVRNLTAAEMLEQIYETEKINDIKVANVVVMGSGEPLQNLENLVAFLENINSEEGDNISLRNITVSTCGIIPAMYKLAGYKLPVTLAVSLHAPNDDIRKRIMPVANLYSVKELMSACSDYFDITGRRISFEYSLMRGINDSEENAAELASLIKGLNCHVNLINVNPVEEKDFKKSQEKAIMAFKNKLEKNQINVTIRRELGQDIDGACGQLRRRYPE